MTSALDHEREHLKLADSHMVEGEHRLEEQRLRVDRMRSEHHDIAMAEKLVTTLEQTLVERRKHRDFIVERIRSLEAGGA